MKTWSLSFCLLFASSVKNGPLTCTRDLQASSTGVSTAAELRVAEVYVVIFFTVERRKGETAPQGFGSSLFFLASQASKKNKKRKPGAPFSWTLIAMNFFDCFDRAFWPEVSGVSTPLSSFGEAGKGRYERTNAMNKVNKAK